MEFRVLGPLEVVYEGAPLSLGGTRQRALLAVLLLNANQVVSSDRLIDELWAESPPETAAHVVQVYVSQLRKVIGHERLVTKRPGYVLVLGAVELDLNRFEQLLAGGREALPTDPEGAGRLLRQALDLWRGPALAEFAYEPFAQNAIGRLDELRLVALEERIESDLALGRHAESVGELEGIIRGHPLRERPRGQLMLALYRSGRQAEALEQYQATRRVLVEELGIDPSPALQQMERQILNHDSALDLAARPPESPGRAGVTRSILLVPRSDAELEALVALAEPLASSRYPHALVLARLVAPPELAAASAAVQEQRNRLLERGLDARATAFTSSAWDEDVARLALQQEVDLVLLDERGADVAEHLRAGPVRAVLDAAPSDVALVVSGAGTGGGPVFVPFGGGDHEWGALELGAWFATAFDVPLRLLGTAADVEQDRRDASRLLGSAALAVQQLAGVVTEPVLLPGGAESVTEAAAAGSLLVVGLSPRWHQEGLGAVRHGIVTRSTVPTILVRRGDRPGGLAPPEALTRFTWSVGDSLAPGT